MHCRMTSIVMSNVRNRIGAVLAKKQWLSPAAVLLVRLVISRAKLAVRCSATFSVTTPVSLVVAAILCSIVKSKLHLRGLTASGLLQTPALPNKPHPHLHNPNGRRALAKNRRVKRLFSRPPKWYVRTALT